MFKKVVMAENAEFCFGVKRAMDTSIGANKNGNSNIYTFGSLVHNKDVTNSLKDKRINEIDINNLDKFKSGDMVIFVHIE